MVKGYAHLTIHIFLESAVCGTRFFKFFRYSFAMSHRQKVLSIYMNSNVLIFPKFVTKVMEYLCSGWFFFRLFLSRNSINIIQKVLLS